MPKKPSTDQPPSVQGEREAIVLWLREEAVAARHAQASADADSPDKIYRMGQKDALLLAASEIESGHHVSLPPQGPE